MQFPRGKIISINYLEFICMGFLPYLPYLLMCLITQLYHYGFIGIYVILWVIIHYYFVLLFTLCFGSLFSWVLCSFAILVLLCSFDILLLLCVIVYMDACVLLCFVF